MPHPALGGATHFSTAATAVDCHKQVRSYRLLRTLAELFLPACLHPPPTLHPPPSTPQPLTGTIFGHRHGKVKFSVQPGATAPPLLLLELAVSTAILARQMRGGHLRIALVPTLPGQPPRSTSAWTMYCNGKRVGLATRIRPSRSDLDVLTRMGSVVSEAGVVTRRDLGSSEDVLYLRGGFHRVSGSAGCESFHLIDPDGSINQDLGIFFLGSR